MTEIPQVVANAFRDRVVALTGASSGIGREMALQLATAGAKLGLAARGEAELEAVAAECRERGAETIAVVTDVTAEADCRAFVERCVEAFGRLDTFIANAGSSMWSRFDELETLAPLESLLRVNYLGAAYGAYYALPHLKATGGRLVGVSSVTGKTGVPLRSGYAAAKHAMAGFFDSLRIELRTSGVSVTMVYPDFVATPTREKSLGSDGRPLGTSPVDESAVMSAEECARQILDAAARRRRERVLSRRGRWGQWLKLVAPGLIDRIAERAILRGR